MANVEMTEFLDLDADELHLVKRGANGFPQLLAKSVALEIEDAQKATITSSDTDSSEADEEEDKITKSCDQPDCPVCADRMAKGRLKAKDRRALPKGDFAIPEKAPGPGSYPLPDKAHAGVALSLVSQHGTPQEKKRVRAAVRRKFPKIDVSKSPGVPDFATATPKEAGHITDTGQSGQRMKPMQTGTRRPPGVTTAGGETALIGGSSTAVIPEEERITHPPAATLTAKMAYTFTHLAEFMDRVDAQRAAKDTSWLAQPSGAAAEAPSSGPWEAYDSASLTEVAQLLAACGKAIDAIQTREAVEAVNGNVGDFQDTADLGMAGDALDAALGIVARLAFHEGASKEGEDGEAEKAGRRLSGKTESALRAARDHLTSVLGEDKTQAGHTGEPSEEDQIMTTLTKEELDQQIAEGSATAAKEAIKQERQRAKKAAKKEAKLARKNANNDGDISRGEMEDQVHGHADASDVNAIPDGGHVDSQYANKSKGGKSKKGTLTKDMRQVRELVERMANRPRVGGPNLTGVIPQGFVPNGEGRTGEEAVKSTEDAEIDSLRKQLDEAQKETGPSAMQRASQLSYQLTRKLLVQGHRTGES